MFATPLRGSKRPALILGLFRLRSGGHATDMVLSRKPTFQARSARGNINHLKTTGGVGIFHKESAAVPSVKTTPLQGIYPAFPATGGIRPHPRCGNSLARCSAVSSQVDQEFYRRLQDMVAAAAVARVRDRRPSLLTEGHYKGNFTMFCNSE